MATWRELLASVRERGIDELEARRIIEQASGYDGGELVVALDERASRQGAAAANAMAGRRASGEPLQYVLGRWGFRTLDLMVDGRVLIPRPETEQVVEAAIVEAKRLDPPPNPLVAVDLGTGSGAIAISLAVELNAEVWATDHSPDAIAVARANVAGAGWPASTRIRVVQGDWFAALPTELRGAISLLVSNPPYIAAGEDLPAEVQDWEPAVALRAGPTGLEAIETILRDAPDWLARPAVAVIEIAPHQAADACAIAFESGFDEVDTAPDLARRVRSLIARLAQRC